MRSTNKTVLASAAVMALLLAPLVARSAKQAEQQHSKEYTSAAAKISTIQNGGGKSQTVELTAEECSAYVSEGGVKLPNGVDNVRFTSTPGEITAVTKVDFDKITGGRSSMNPLMMLFSGTHEVTTKARGEGAAGRATVSIESVQIDGVTVPRAALEYFVSKYIQPKYGDNVGMNSTFAMPAGIQTAVVGENKITVTQK